jgi:hypothetical protein
VAKQDSGSFGLIKCPLYVDKKIPRTQLYFDHGRGVAVGTPNMGSTRHSMRQKAPEQIISDEVDDSKLPV